MKKLVILIAAIALVCFSVPAMADWNFYGNSRIQTFYVSEDFGDGTNAAGTDSKDARIDWSLQGNSRIGATVKAEAVSGRFELGLKASDDTQDIGTAGDGDVGTRRIEGYWNFGAGRLGVGKGYTPINQFLSGQVFAGDAGLLGRGFMYGGRPGFISLQFGGFDVALITNFAEGNDAADLGLTGDVDVFLPKIEASYGMSFDTWNFAIRGGAQTYEIEDAVTPTGTEDVTVTSWIIGGDAGWNFGPGYLRGALSYGSNLGQARWAGQKGATIFDGDDDTEDVLTFQAGLVAGIKVSDMMSFEGGFGFVNSNPDDAPSARDEETTQWEVYVQGLFQLAPGVFIIPEVGYIDLGNSFLDAEQGSTIYAGAKWQINF